MPWTPKTWVDVPDQANPAPGAVPLSAAEMQRLDDGIDDLYGRFNTFTVASEAAMIALSAKKGDVAIRTDLTPDGAFRLTTDDPTLAANWAQISGFGGGGGGTPDAHATSHVTGGSDVIASAVASGNAGLMSGADKTKLNGIEANATTDQTRPEIVGLWTGTPDGTKYLRDDGTLATPSGGSSEFTKVALGSDVANSTTSYADVTGLSFAVVSGTIYFFEADIIYDSAAVTTGSKWSVNGPAFTGLCYFVDWTGGSSSRSAIVATTYDATGGGAPSSGSVLAGNLCAIRGFVLPSANGTLAVRFGSEVAASAITAKAGSTLRYRSP